MFKPSIIIFTVLSKAVFLLWIVFVIFVCFAAVLSVPCSLVITCWERACLLALLCIVFSYVSVTSPFVSRVRYMVLGFIDSLTLPSSLLLLNVCILARFFSDVDYVLPIRRVGTYEPPTRKVGDILFLVQIMSTSASAFVSVHYLLSQSADFDQTSIDTFLGEGKEMIRFW